MIYVTSGSSPLGYDELFSACDAIAARNRLWQFTGQIGNSTFKPAHYKYQRWYSHQEMLENIKAAALVISHAGFGIISESLRSNKKLIVVPRLSKSYHSQSSLADYLHNEGYLVCVKDLSMLEDSIRYLLTNDLKKYNSNTIIPELINDYISGFTR
jgi:Uncharacterized conserved protein